MAEMTTLSDLLVNHSLAALLAGEGRGAAPADDDVPADAIDDEEIDDEEDDEDDDDEDDDDEDDDEDDEEDTEAAPE